MEEEGPWLGGVWVNAFPANFLGTIPGIVQLEKPWVFKHIMCASILVFFLNENNGGMVESRLEPWCSGKGVSLFQPVQ